ncbi:hypothetical protein IT084_02165 [Desulfallas sp. Bu1-1]|uniref:DUF6789 family protein n=1 Tax=Desulfallas sp. Bu1-1 TaxID=2787620 RepID=UPI00189C9F6E|nr:DUF6789 family protein [Desulfallas sp. Bu1-1]MBF7081784.1 hypothetical protein [Desulfallas sp. Bu1-1]
MQDRLANGFLAGLAGGVAMNIVNLASYYLNIATLRFLDWSAVAIYGHKPHSFWEAAFAQAAQLVFVGTLGIIFAYLIPVLTSKNYLLRGWLFGTAVWFSLYGLTLLFQIQDKIPVFLATAVTDFVSASIYGLVQAEAFQRLGKRAEV